MFVLVACEESQIVCSAFRSLGHIAFSCDLVPCSGLHPEWHILGDCVSLLDGNCSFLTQDNIYHFVPKWDLIIAHPPCTYLTVTGNRWFNVEKYGFKAVYRLMQRNHAIDFFMKFVHANCDKIAIENPVGYMSSFYRKPDQIIQPYMFGDSAEKRTCLWLKGLNPLLPTNVVSPPPRIKFDSGRTMPSWYADCWNLPKETRSKIRSKTFPGIAYAMAEQWG